MKPLVSAVIPTRNRPLLVLRAVQSALRQTYANLEVIVVIDGSDPATVASLGSIADPRLRIVALQENVRGSEARNIGVRNARGEWIAFLDDDDEWLPEKTEKQMFLLEEGGFTANFCACRFRKVAHDFGVVLPHSFPEPEEDWSEHFYCLVAGLPLPSTYIASKEFMLRVPFTKGLLHNEDTDWLLRARKSNLIKPVWLAEPLCIYHCDHVEVRISTGSSWEFSYRWALENRNILLSPKAFSFCLVRLCVPRAKNSRHPAACLLRLLYAAVTKGRVNLRFCAYFAGYAILSDPMRVKFGKVFSHV
ncbi:MAG: glycosyltransferase [Terracidiphilus sp.]|jgi:glycosyltransferase involved in cell wall biosynthesis